MKILAAIFPQLYDPPRQLLIIVSQILNLELALTSAQVHRRMLVQVILGVAGLRRVTYSLLDIAQIVLVFFADLVRPQTLLVTYKLSRCGVSFLTVHSLVEPTWAHCFSSSRRVIWGLTST